MLARNALAGARVATAVWSRQASGLWVVNLTAETEVRLRDDIALGLAAGAPPFAFSLFATRLQRGAGFLGALERPSANALEMEIGPAAGRRLERGRAGPGGLGGMDRAEAAVDWSAVDSCVMRSDMNVHGTVSIRWGRQRMNEAICEIRSLWVWLGHV